MYVDASVTGNGFDNVAPRRACPKLDKAFRARVKENGVLVPIVAHGYAEDVDGQRRCRTGLQAADVTGRLATPTAQITKTADRVLCVFAPAGFERRFERMIGETITDELSGAERATRLLGPPIPAPGGEA